MIARPTHLLAGLLAVATVAAPLVTAPAVASTVRTVAPAVGPSTGGTRVLVTGTGLHGARRVEFGTVDGSGLRVLGDSVVSVVAPPHAAGRYPIHVITPDGTSRSATVAAFTYLRRPAVLSVSPTTGIEDGGTVVSVHGWGFTSATTVRFGSAQGYGVQVDSDTDLRVTAPPLPSGVVDVQVATKGGLSAITSRDRFTVAVPPTVTAVTPSSGTSEGGQHITVTGTGFAGSVSVLIDGSYLPATVRSATSLDVVTPPHPAGPVDVRVSTSDGTSAATPADVFTYLAAPAPVQELAVQTATRTAVTLRWRLPEPASGPAPDRIVVVGTAGTTAPTDPTCCNQVVVAGTATTATVSDLQPGARYAFSVFAESGSLVSSPTSVFAPTPLDSAPDTPTQISVNHIAPSSSTCTRSAPCLLGAFADTTLAVGAPLSDPDPNTLITGHFTVTDLGGTPDASPVVILGPTDPGGTSSAGYAPTYGVVRVPTSTLVAGHLYSVTVVADDGTRTSAPSEAYYFRYAPGRPMMSPISGPSSGIKVGTPFTVTFTATDDNPPVTGVVSFEYDLAYGYDFSHSIAATKVGDVWTATLTITPTTWGTAYVYARAVNAAGNRSGTVSFQYYAAS